MPKHSKSRRKRKPSDTSSSDEDIHPKRRKKHKTKDLSTSSSDSSSEEEDKRKKKVKRKTKESKESKKRKKEKKVKHKTKKEKKSRKKESSPVIVQVPKEPVQTTERKGPMTKEEYEKLQNVTKRVFDPDTGRMRLVRGTGEIIEEIVSKEQQKKINKLATLGDGISYSIQTGTLK